MSKRKTAFQRFINRVLTEIVVRLGLKKRPGRPKGSKTRVKPAAVLGIPAPDKASDAPIVPTPVDRI